jgi:2,3-bisphosphoglycerate-independent phosphoglycerate mutase
VLVTADHGNVELMCNPGGAVHTAHTSSPVPFVLAHEPARGASLRRAASLCDVAPTVLELLGIDPPAAMTGRSLLGPEAEDP